ncbi:MAG: winged helix-turn-helix domain-containing protein, partial [Methylococcales bacterium]|nr:winged helix-turn-helix domain-containing protein [Methylococcales bacterium]
MSDEDLLSYIKQDPSATLEEIATHLSVKIPSVHARLKQCGVTRKKKTFLYEERDEQARAEFIEQLKMSESQPMVYL